MMLLSRVLLIEFGVFMAAAMGLLAWQVVRAWWAQPRRLSLDETVLLVVAVAACSAYGVELVRAGGGVMPGVNRVWVAVFGVSCAVHVGSKAMRILTKR